MLSAGLADRLSGQGFQDPASESAVGLDRIAAATGSNPRGEIIALIRTKGPVRREGRAAAARALKRLLADPDMGRVISPFDPQRSAPGLISPDGRSAILVANLQPGRDEGDAPARLQKAFAGDRAIALGGSGIAQHEVSKTVESDLRRAELLAFPLLFLFALFVFRGLIAAALPLLVGGITIPLTFALISAYDQITDLSVFALNLTTGLGLGLAIDYSLLMVSRFREELEAGNDPGQAVKRTVATAGRTVAFSSLTVAGCAGVLAIFPLKFLYSMGFGGATVALASATVALTLLPAVLFLLGHRVNSISLARKPIDHSIANWRRLARGVMRRPVIVALTATALLLTIGLPALNIKFTSVDASVLSADSEPRIVQEAIQQEFAPGDGSSTLYVVARGSRSAAAEIAGLAKRVSDLPTVRTVDEPTFIGASTWRFNVFPRGSRYSEPAQDTVDSIRAIDTDLTRWVTGSSAEFVDQRASILNRVPLALLLIGIITFAILFLMTGSLILPLKTFVMNVLTLAATFGILKMVFQEGRLEGLLNYDSQQALEMTQPVLLFAIAFGLATDYGVFLLGRIREFHLSGLDNNAAVAEGVARTGRVITAAALLFCIAIGAFSTSGIIFVKELGIGTALAVAIDATIVRALLVPALMVMLGDYNWWAPKPLARLHRWIGLSESGPARTVTS